MECAIYFFIVSYYVLYIKCFLPIIWGRCDCHNINVVGVAFIYAITINTC